MAFKVNATTVFNNSGQLPWAQVGLWTGSIRTLSVSTSGDGANPKGTSGCSLKTVSFDSSSGTLSATFDTNCLCFCDACGGSG